MGGGRHFHIPKYVWSPSGGWHANPPNWKRNTAFALFGIGLAFIAIARVSSEREVRLSLELSEVLWPLNRFHHFCMQKASELSTVRVLAFVMYITGENL